MITYKEAIDFLFNSLPMYQRQGKAAYKDNLDNTLKLDNYLCHPHQSFSSIHVAGTNGKGSVSHMLSSVLQQAGYQTGLYTSPHLLDFRERIRINGIPISKEAVTDFINLHQPVIQEISPSFFEMTVAMAFEYFGRQKVDVAVVETGLGGRLDSTNIITPVLSIITNIALDHTEFLGENLSSIAKEKGGIIKEGVPLVIGRANEEIESLFLSMAQKKQSVTTLAYNSYKPAFNTINQEGSSITRIRKMNKGAIKGGAMESGSPISVTCDLTGDYQRENLVTVLTAIDQLRELGWSIPEPAVKAGLAAVVKNTGIKGRWQTIGHNPRSVCDTAHNHDGISAVMKQISQIPRKELHMVWGMVNDKDLDAIFPLLPPLARYYFTRSSVPRSIDPIRLQSKAKAYKLFGETFDSVQAAYKTAQQFAGADDMIFTGGSTFVVADLLKASGY